MIWLDRLFVDLVGSLDGFHLERETVGTIDGFHLERVLLVEADYVNPKPLVRHVYLLLLHLSVQGLVLLPQ